MPRSWCLIALNMGLETAPIFHTEQSMKFVTVTELSALGKSAIAAIATVTMLTTLLANPQVQKIVGYVPEPPTPPAA